MIKQVVRNIRDTELGKFVTIGPSQNSSLCPDVIIFSTDNIHVIAKNAFNNVTTSVIFDDIVDHIDGGTKGTAATREARRKAMLAGCSNSTSYINSESWNLNTSWVAPALSPGQADFTQYFGGSILLQPDLTRSGYNNTKQDTGNSNYTAYNNGNGTYSPFGMVIKLVPNLGPYSGAPINKFTFRLTTDWCMDLTIQDWVAKTTTINSTHVCPEKGQWTFNGTIPGFGVTVKQKSDKWESGFTASYTTNVSTTVNFEIWGTYMQNKDILAQGDFDPEPTTNPTDSSGSTASPGPNKFTFRLSSDWCLNLSIQDFWLNHGLVTINGTHVCPEKGLWNFTSIYSGFGATIKQKAGQWESGFSAVYTTNSSTTTNFDIWGTWIDNGVIAQGEFKP
jgi:hypothetical protein